jgi:hypothetical protein
MGERLVNELSWSFSRHSIFQECPKKYWYTYYGSWEGWPRTPYDTRPSIDPLASYLYTMKQIQALPAFVGSCVHEAIEHALKKGFTSKERKLPERDELCSFALKKFQKGIEDSKSGAWKEAPKKHANLFEFYFCPPEKVPLESTKEEEYRKKITTCLENWLSSPIARMAYDTRSKWLSAEELTHFSLNGNKIIVVVDFAMKWKGAKDDILILFDWKTGKESEKTEEQLYAYALWAHHALGTPFDKLILSPFYLFDNSYTKIGTGQTRPLDALEAKRIEELILSSCEKMKKVHSSEPLGPDVQLFPHTENRNFCARCPFQNLCKKTSFKTLSRKELTADGLPLLLRNP